MAILKGKYHPPKNDYADTVHFETDSEMVIMSDGSSLKDKLDTGNINIPVKAPNDSNISLWGFYETTKYKFYEDSNNMYLFTDLDSNFSFETGATLRAIVPSTNKDGNYTVEFAFDGQYNSIPVLKNRNNLGEFIQLDNGDIPAYKPFKLVYIGTQISQGYSSPFFLLVQ